MPGFADRPFSRQRIGGTFVPLAPPGATVQVEAFVR
jgi:hypothetical protein